MTALLLAAVPAPSKGKGCFTKHTLTGYLSPRKAGVDCLLKEADKGLHGLIDRYQLE